MGSPPPSPSPSPSPFPLPPSPFPLPSPHLQQRPQRPPAAAAGRDPSILRPFPSCGAPRQGSLSILRRSRAMFLWCASLVPPPMEMSLASRKSLSTTPSPTYP